MNPGERFRRASAQIWSEFSKGHATEALVQLADPEQRASPRAAKGHQHRYSITEVEREFGPEAAAHYAEIAAATDRFRKAVMKKISATHRRPKTTDDA